MFPFNRRHKTLSWAIGGSFMVFISLLFVGCGGGAAVVLRRLQSRLQAHPEPKLPSENGSSSKPVLPRPLRRIWILAEE
jgi:hypothetical protein